MKSRTDIEAPKRLIPKTDRAEPHRTKLLIETDEPILRKSKTERDDPMRLSP
jgi:hypothetical protein